MAAFSVYVIPDSGDPKFKAGFKSAVDAESSGVAEARLMIRTRPAVASVEVVTIEGREHLSTTFISRGAGK